MVSSAVARTLRLGGGIETCSGLFGENEVLFSSNGVDLQLQGKLKTRRTSKIPRYLEVFCYHVDAKPDLVEGFYPWSSIVLRSTPWSATQSSDLKR
jgi:hypothetical protein